MNTNTFKMLSNITNQGFSEVTVTINNKILSENLLSRIITEFFTKFIKTDRKYFILLKFQFENGSVKTLHKGLIISYTQLSQYINYCNEMAGYPASVTDEYLKFVTLTLRHINVAMVNVT